MGSFKLLTNPVPVLHFFCSGSSTFLQRGSPPPPPWRLLPEPFLSKFRLPPQMCLKKLLSSA